MTHAGAFAGNDGKDCGKHRTYHWWSDSVAKERTIDRCVVSLGSQPKEASATIAEGSGSGTEATAAAAAVAAGRDEGEAEGGEEGEGDGTGAGAEDKCRACAENLKTLYYSQCT